MTLGRKITVLFAILLLGACCLAQGAVSDSTQINDSELTIKGIFIIGNDKTYHAIIRRELNFATGEKLLRSDLEKIIKRDQQKIFNLGLFNTVQIELLETSSSEVDVLIRVEERWYLFVSPVFRLVDRNFNDWWVNRNRDLSRVNYGFNVLHYNMRGRNEKLKVNVRFGFTTILSFDYRFPYIDKKQKQGLSFSFGYSKRRNIAFNTIDHRPEYYESENVMRESFSPSVTYTYRNGFFNRHAFTVDYNHSLFSDTVNVLNSEYVEDNRTQQRYLRLAYSFARDQRDYRSYPLEGYLVGFSVEQLGFGLFGEDVNQWRTMARFSKFFDFGKGFYSANSFTTLMSTRKNQEYPNYNAMGFGNVIIRGYELELIESPMFLLQKNSLRKRIIKGSYDMGDLMPIKQFKKIPFAVYAKVFFDHGWAESYPFYDGSDRLTNKYLYGMGAGIDVIGLYDLVLRVEYSLNAEQETHLFFNIKAGI